MCNINVELFLMNVKLIQSLTELRVLTEEQLFLLKDQPKNFEKKLKFIKTEISNLNIQIDLANEDIENILKDIEILELDKIIELSHKTYPEYINKLLDIRINK